jgi:hypothetical protein
VARIDEISVEEQPLEWDTPLFRTAVAQFEEALTHADVDPGASERLRYPEAAIMVSIPVRMDDGTWSVFPASCTRASSARRKAESATTRTSRWASARRSRCG